VCFKHAFRVRALFAAYAIASPVIRTATAAAVQPQYAVICCPVIAGVFPILSMQPFFITLIIFSRCYEPNLPYTPRRAHEGFRREELDRKAAQKKKSCGETRRLESRAGPPWCMGGSPQTRSSWRRLIVVPRFPERVRFDADIVRAGLNAATKGPSDPPLAARYRKQAVECSDLPKRESTSEIK
jgi:hypothetical protein